jgi:hypothetical protein
MDRRAAAFGAGVALGIWIMAIAILVLSCLAPTVRAASVGTAEIVGVATWCAPTPTKCQSWGGDAHKGAVPGYDGHPYSVLVCLADGPACTDVTVVSSCACGDRNGKATVIDLSPAAFRDLAPTSVGVIDVTLERFVLPPTDTVAELDLYAILNTVR